MSDVAREEIVEMVQLVWPDDAAIVGRDVVSDLVCDPKNFESANAGDEIDLAAIMDVIKSAIELVTAGLALYTAVREHGKSRQEADTEFQARLSQAERNGEVTGEQVAKLRELIAARR